MALTPVTAYAAQDTEVIAEGNSAAEIPADAEDLGGGVEELIDEPAPAGAAGESEQTISVDGFEISGLTEETEELGCEGKKETTSGSFGGQHSFSVRALGEDSEIAYTLSWVCQDGTQGAEDMVSVNSLYSWSLPSAS